MFPLVSIALCTYNGESYLKEQLNSLLTQTYKNIEVIIVDDCSKDSTWKLLQEYSGVGDFLITRNENNLGFVKNFEKAIKLCKGDLIAFCDQDDIWMPEKIEKLVNLIGDNLLVYCNSEMVDEDGISLNKKTSDFRNFVRGSYPNAFIYSNCISGHAMLIRRELVDYILPFPGCGFHDWWIGYVASLIGTIDYTDQVLVKYRQHSKAASNKKNVKKLQKDKFEHWGHMVTFFQRLRALNFELDKDIQLLDKLILYLQNKETNFFSFSYFSFLSKNKKELFLLSKKSNSSLINLMFKECRGKRWFWFSNLKGRVKGFI